MAHELYDYEVALSFAGEDRGFVEEVAAFLRDNNIRVFYDQDERVAMWGKELTEQFDAVFRKQSRFAVIFVSKHYAEKVWPTLEKRTILCRAMETKCDYILPARFDDTDLLGLRPSIGYIDLRNETPESFGGLIMAKLAQVTPSRTESVGSGVQGPTIIRPAEGYDLSLEILTLCLRIRDEIRKCQHPFMSVDELSQREKDGKKRLEETQQQSGVLDSWYASMKRYEKILDVKSRLDGLVIKAEIFFGAEARAKIEHLYIIVRRLGFAIRHYHEDRLYGGPERTRDRISQNIINGVSSHGLAVKDEEKSSYDDGGFEEDFRASIADLKGYFDDKMSGFLQLADN